MRYVMYCRNRAVINEIKTEIFVSYDFSAYIEGKVICIRIYSNELAN